MKLRPTSAMSNTKFPELRETLSRYTEIETQGEAIRKQLEGLGTKRLIERPRARVKPEVPQLTRGDRFHEPSQE